MMRFGSLFVVALAVFSTTVTAGDKDYEDEGARLVQAYTSFTPIELRRVRGSRFFRRIVDHMFAFIEATPIVGEQVQEWRETDPSGFSERELEEYLNTPSQSKNVERMLGELYRETVGFMARITSDPGVTDSVRARVLDEVSRSTAATFIELTRHYEDPFPAPSNLGSYWESYEGAGYFRWWSGVHFGFDWARYHAQWIGREVTALFTGQALPVPLVELSAERRTHATEQLAREVRDQVRKDLARLRSIQGQASYWPGDLVRGLVYSLQSKFGKADQRNEEQVLASLIALEELLRETESSKPMTDGGWHRMVRRFYFAQALYFLYFGGWEVGPLLGWSMGLAERTLGGSVAAMVQWTGFSLWLARSRYQNSGARYHRMVHGSALPLIGARGLYGDIRGALERNADLVSSSTLCRALLAEQGRVSTQVPPDEPADKPAEEPVQPPRRRRTRR